MIIIAHRGNINGSNPDKENHPTQIKQALSSGFNVEIDIWWENNKFVLGHDKGIYDIESGFLYNDRLWIHCKNIEALYKLINNPLVNAFYHNTDDCVLTSKKYIWTFPNINNKLTNRSIAVIPENVEKWDLTGVGGVCTDFPNNYK